MKRKDFITLSSAAISSIFITEGFSETLSLLNRNDEFDVVIVGSGYGAAVAALRLSQKGVKCTIIEMGLNWGKSGIPYSTLLAPGKSSAWLRNTTIAPFGNFQYIDKFTGALDRLEFEHIKVYAGRGVGGGSLVNGGMAVLPKQNYFKEVFPNLDDVEFYTKYYPRAQQALKVNEIPDPFFNSTEFYQFARVGEMQAHKAGYKTVRVPNVYDFNYMQEEHKNNVPRSAFNEEVIYGNNHGKNSLDKTYLKEAMATGLVTILDLSEVTDILPNAKNGYTLKVKVINTSGTTVSNKEIDCKKLFLCAGSMGTTQLLVKSKGNGSLPDLNDEVGMNWGNNGNLMTGRNFIGSATGTSQSTIPTSGIDNWEDALNPFFAEISPLPMDMEAWTTLYLVINKLKKMGNFYFDKTTNSVKLNWDKTHTDDMVTNALKFIDRMNAANGGTIASLLFNSGIGEDICYHPLGGCVIGKATDKYGRVKGADNLYVIDGSLIPGTIGVNPFLTITALAEYCLEHIIDEDFSANAIPELNEEAFAVQVNPNPFVDQLTIHISSQTNKEVVVDIYSIAGEQVVYAKNLKLQVGSNTIEFNNLHELSADSYLLRISCGLKMQTHKLVKGIK
jgi:cholesterol oxidase